MEFTTFNAETCPQQLESRSHVFKNLTIRSQGSLMIARQSAQELGINEKTRIVFLRDKNYPTDWYIQKTDDEKGYQLRRNKNGSFTINSYPLARAILDSVMDMHESFVTITFPLTITKHGLALDVKHYKITTKK